MDGSRRGGSADDPVPVHRLDVPEPGTLPFAIGSFDAIGPLSRADFPHRHRFHEIVYVTAGRGSHLVDFVEYPIRPPQLWVIVPGQVHSWGSASGLSGQVVLFTEDFLREHPDDRETLRSLGGRPWLRPGAADADRIAAAVAELAHEFRARGTGFPAALRSLLHVLIVRARRLPGAAPAPSAPNRAARVARDFARLLGGPDPTWHTVPAYAAQLGVSVSYLADAVRRSTGTAPGRLVRQARVLEARRLLAGSDLTVGRIAERLGFTDAAYFCRFFRRETGQTPGDYRRDAGGYHHDRRAGSLDPTGTRP